ncbi:transcription initiation factor TFIID subunit 11-like [Primulina huaijiensis]|uniref:transcription initiation factor TFIID subunit 11-like n=1 Tax=Primulina huaijiensis TaxID=1492673 RepID=UPI003CC73A3D
MDVELGKLQSSGDPDKVAKMQILLAKFTDEQVSRRRLLTSITGSAKISVPMTIVVSGIGKMFVGELIETARMVMSERKEHRQRCRVLVSWVMK